MPIFLSSPPLLLYLIAMHQRSHNSQLPKEAMAPARSQRPSVKPTGIERVTAARQQTSTFLREYQLSPGQSALLEIKNINNCIKTIRKTKHELQSVLSKLDAHTDFLGQLRAEVRSDPEKDVTDRYWWYSSVTSRLLHAAYGVDDQVQELGEEWNNDEDSEPGEVSFSEHASSKKNGEGDSSTEVTSGEEESSEECIEGEDFNKEGPEFEERISAE